MTITLRTALPELYNDLCEVIRLFYGECEIHEDADGEICIVHTVEDEKHVVRVENVEKNAPLTPVGEDELENKRLCKRAVKNTVYAALKELTGKRIPWGSLTGIRPTRLFYEQLAAGLDEEAACRALMEKFDVSREKAELLRDIARVQRGMEQPKRDFACRTTSSRTTSRSTSAFRSAVRAVRIVPLRRWISSMAENLPMGMLKR